MFDEMLGCIVDQLYWLTSMEPCRYDWFWPISNQIVVCVWENPD